LMADCAPALSPDLAEATAFLLRVLSSETFAFDAASVRYTPVVKRVNVPQIQTIERVMPVPQVMYQEVVVPVPVNMPQVVVRQVPVPQLQIMERVVEVPAVPKVTKENAELTNFCGELCMQVAGKCSFFPPLDYEGDLKGKKAEEKCNKTTGGTLELKVIR